MGIYNQTIENYYKTRLVVKCILQYWFDYIMVITLYSQYKVCKIEQFCEGSIQNPAATGRNNQLSFGILILVKESLSLRQCPSSLVLHSDFINIPIINISYVRVLNSDAVLNIGQLLHQLFPKTRPTSASFSESVVRGQLQTEVVTRGRAVTFRNSRFPYGLMSIYLT